MEQWLAPALILLAMVGVLAYMVWRSGRSPRPAHTESYYGPLPERESERAEITDPGQFGQVTPGAVTPAAAGSPEQYYASTGVGRGGPQHLSGPPPLADLSTSRYAPERARESNRFKLTALVAASGVGLGLMLVALIRRATRRRSRIEELRHRASRASRMAQHRASELREQVDQRTAGSALGVLASAVVLAAIRRRREQREAARRTEEARVAAEAAMNRGWSRLRLGLSALRNANGTARIGTATQEARAQLLGGRPGWLLVGGAVGLAALLALLVSRAARQRERDWWPSNVPDSAPAREAPASP
jgi:hypothetical protein